MDACKRTCIVGHLVGQYGVAKGCIALKVTVRADEEAMDLGFQVINRPGNQRASMKILQTFVHATHAPPLATCEDYTGNLFGVHTQWLRL
jgi:hypothetical protein